MNKQQAIQEPWRQALEKFLQKWLPRPDVIGSLVCGSYVTGNPSPYSDIDIHLVLAEHVDWRERGNARIDSYLIEYFANPACQIRQYFQEDHAENRPIAATQFVTGEIIYDPQGVVIQLQAEANTWLSTPFQPLSETQMELMNYGLWDQLEKLWNAHEHGHAELSFVFAHFVYQLVVFYARYLKVPVPSVHQLSLLWEPERAYQKYRQCAFPDAVFTELLQQTLQQAATCDYDHYAETLYTHVMNHTDGFEIDGWKFHSPVTVERAKK